MKIIISAYHEFCRSNMLQKIKLDRTCATWRGNKILLQRQLMSTHHDLEITGAILKTTVILTVIEI